MTREEAIKETYEIPVNEKQHKALQILIPELKESKDERIREKIVSIIEQYARICEKEGDPCLELNDCLIYLEKQKENPDRPILIGKAKSEKQVVLLTESNGDENIYWDTKSEEDAVSLLEKGLKFFGKQKEQKPLSTEKTELNSIAFLEQMGYTCIPPEWAIKPKPIFRVGETIIAKDGTCIPKELFHIERIEDGCYWDGDGSILICNQDDFQLIDQHLTEWSEDIIQKAIKEVGLTHHQIDWFKTNVFPPKQEWSEEDEEKLVRLLYSISIGNNSKEMRNWLLLKLKSIRPQPNQKWSEEEKNGMFSDIIMAIRAYYKCEREDLVEYFKSLRPQPNTVSVDNAVKFGSLEYERGVKDGIHHAENHQWKPSEEQMAALKNVVETYRQRHNVSVGGDCIFIGVESLYNDIIKL